MPTFLSSPAYMQLSFVKIKNLRLFFWKTRKQGATVVNMTGDQNMHEYLCFNMKEKREDPGNIL